MKYHNHDVQRGWALAPKGSCPRCDQYRDEARAALDKIHAKREARAAAMR
jgi:hypothetical protein